MKLETFKAGRWQQRYQYKSFEPVPVNHEWTWEEPSINTLLESDFFERHRASYYDALMRVRVSNDLIHWVRFFLNGVAQTATKGRDVFRQILVPHSTLFCILRASPNAPRQGTARRE